MSDALETTGSPDSPVRSTSGVLLLLAGLVLLPLLALLLILGLRGAGSSGGGAALASLVAEDRVQAVYMATGDVFFGRVRDTEGDAFVLEDAFFLRRATASGAKEDDAQAGLDLVSVAQDVGGDGDLVINAREVVRIQDLAEDAEIATSIEDALED